MSTRYRIVNAAVRTALRGMVWSTIAGGVWCQAQGVVTEDDAYFIDSGTVLTADGDMGNPPGVLANDSNVPAEPDDFGLLVLEPPRHGELELEPDGTFTYIPDPNFHGVDTFRYAIEPAGDTVTLTDEGSTWKILNPLDGRPPDFDDPDFDQTWTSIGYDDTAWLDGSGVMGYGVLGDLRRIPFNTELMRPASGLRFSTYFRTTLTTLQPLSGRLSMSMIRDDAAILYWDGTEFHREHKPGARLVGEEEDDYFLFVEGNNVAWVARDEESTTYVRQGPRIEIQPGEHVIAASLHNNLNPSAMTSSDLGFSLSLVLNNHYEATATITVNDIPSAPVIQPDVFFVADGEVLDTATLKYNLYTNDGLLDENSTPYDPIVDLQFDTADADGVLLSSDSQTGDFRFQPSGGVGSRSVLTYRVVTANGTSANLPIQIYTVAPDDPLAASVVGVRRGAGLTLSIPGFAKGSTIVAAPTAGRASAEENRVSYWPSGVGPDELTAEISLVDSFAIEPMAEWRVLYPQDGMDPDIADPDFDSTWMTPSYDDSSWGTGAGLFGAGEFDGIEVDTVLPLPPEGNRFSAYFRHEFVATAEQAAADAVLQISVDDAAIVYLNGVELERFPDFHLIGDDDYSLQSEFFLTNPSEGQITVPAGMLVDGSNILAVSVHNWNDDADLAFGCLGLATFEHRYRFPVCFAGKSPMQIWRESVFDEAQLADHTISGASADPDGDKLLNVMEHTYGTDPLLADDFNQVTGLDYEMVGGALIPQLNTPTVTPADVSIQLQISTDLSQREWLTYGILYDVSVGAPGPRWASPTGVSAPPPAAVVLPRIEFPADRLFFRFAFELKPWVTDVPR